MIKFIPRSPESFCRWRPDPTEGVQLLKAGRFQWWVFDGDRYVSYLDAMTDGTWAVCMWDYLARGRRPPRRTGLETAARLAVRLKRKKRWRRRSSTPVGRSPRSTG